MFRHISFGQTEIRSLTDERFQFGVMSADLDNGHRTEGFWFRPQISYS